MSTMTGRAGVHRAALVLSSLLLLAAFAAANGGHGSTATSSAGGGTLFDTFVPVTLAATVLLLGATLAALVFRERLTERGKKILMGVLAVIIVAPTLYMFFGTIYVNMTSFTGGEVHWHADFRIYINGEEQQLHDPTGLLDNKVGTPRLHTHNDNRFHVEGVIRHREGATLQAFFDAIGGTYTENRLAFESENGTVNVTERSGKTIQAFVKRGSGSQRSWQPLEEAPHYIISSYSSVPPGDRVVIVYSNRTEEAILQDLREDDVIGHSAETTENGGHEDHEHEH